MNLTKFKEWLILNQDSKRTIEVYYQYVSKFFNQYSEFNQENVNQFFLNLRETHANSTFNLYHSALLSYVNFSNSNVKLPKSKKVQEVYKPYIKEEEMLSICKYIDKLFIDWPRYFICFKFMFYTGVRLSELRKLKRKDINLDEEIVTIEKTKNYKTRNIPIYEKLKKDLIWYFKHENEKINCFNLNKRSIEYMLKIINQQLNPSKKLHPHMLRKSCACWYYYDKNVKLKTIQGILGHKDIKTTIRYLELDEHEMKEDLKKIFNKKGA